MRPHGILRLFVMWPTLSVSSGRDPAPPREEEAIDYGGESRPMRLAGYSHCTGREHRDRGNTIPNVMGHSRNPNPILVVKAMVVMHDAILMGDSERVLDTVQTYHQVQKAQVLRNASPPRSRSRPKSGTADVLSPRGRSAPKGRSPDGNYEIRSNALSPDVSPIYRPAESPKVPPPALTAVPKGKELVRASFLQKGQVRDLAI